MNVEEAVTMLRNTMSRIHTKKSNFQIEEFLIDPEMRSGDKPVPLSVIRKLRMLHIPILDKARNYLDAPIYVSQNSGYRPTEWELAKGRNGTSEHTFRNDGAVDLCVDSYLDLLRLVSFLYWTNYNRICFYPKSRFVHCDFKGRGGEDPQHNLFVDYDDGKGWQWVEKRY